ncbi:MAG: hypothetical protein GXY80_06385 [Syntrophorhabdus aromaticivorans]|uniref:Uncharacterized protein n=1 Tax=Syntrophorhabdus aromaticivorans TaxID=328301 RepID=A0A971M4S5_9BACT|nr:hypothetical protein [Syntrophorhabdus aromaticivorans]
MKKCFKCATPLICETVSRRDECPSCGSDVRVCLNCAFYDEGKANKCRETQAELVKEKDRANYCDYFRFREEGRKKSGKEEADRLWKELFKK